MFWVSFFLTAGRLHRGTPLATGANAGLSIISDLLLDVKKANPDVSFADLRTRAVSVLHPCQRSTPSPCFVNVLFHGSRVA